MNAHDRRRRHCAGLGLGLALSVIACLALVFTLARSGHWDNVLASLAGEYTTHGLVAHPWREFLPWFLVSLLAAASFSWLSTLIAGSALRRPTKLLVGLATMSLASFAFGVCIAQAEISPAYFQDTLVIGTVGSPTLFWLSVFGCLTVLGVVFLRLSSSATEARNEAATPG